MTESIRRNCSFPVFKKRHRAAQKIQRFVSAKLLRIKNQVDPHTLEAVEPGDAILLVEPSGASYRLSKASLGLTCLKHACFTHPVVRRPLLEPEISRLIRLQSDAKVGKLLRLTFKHRQLLQRFLKERRSLLDFLESEAGQAWSLVSSEVLDPDWRAYDIIHFVDLYEDRVWDLSAETRGEDYSAFDLVRLHVEQLRLREPDKEAFEFLCEEMSGFREALRRRRSFRHSCALETWIDHFVRRQLLLQ